MSHKQLTIGFVTNEIGGGYEKSIFNAIKKAAHNLGINLVVYEGRPIGSSLNCDLQHNIILEFVDESQIDGIIFSLGGLLGFIDQDTGEKWLDNYRHIPSVSINVATKKMPSILLDEDRGVSTLMEHMIVDHGYKEFSFISGPALSPEANRRYQGFLLSLKKHNLQFQQKNFFQGDFNPESGIEAMRQIVGAPTDIDAFIFCNDNMAIAAMDYLRRHAPLLLTQCAFAGFDDIPNSQISYPSLTTVAQPYEETANQAMEVISRLIQHKSVSLEYPLRTSLVLRESCGCNVNKRSHYFENLTPFSFKLQENIQSFNRETLFEQLTSALQQFSDINNCFISLYSDSAKVNNEDLAPPPMESELIFAYVNGQRQLLLEPTKFDTTTLLPAYFQNLPNSSIRILKALFFQKERFGFIIFDVLDVQEVELESFRSHLSNMLNGIMLIEAKNSANNESANAYLKIQTLNKRLEQLSITDELTGIYNRRGFYEQTEKYIKTHRNTEYLLFAIDVDDLKTINDTQGHGEGDYAIKAIANIMRKSFYQHDIIGRIGGDEFLACARHDSPDELASILRKFEDNLDEFNTYSKKSYQLSFSIGFSIFQGGKKEQLIQAIEEADQKLYLNKYHRKRPS